MRESKLLNHTILGQQASMCTWMYLPSMIGKTKYSQLTTTRGSLPPHQHYSISTVSSPPLHYTTHLYAQGAGGGGHPARSRPLPGRGTRTTTITTTPTITGSSGPVLVGEDLDVLGAAAAEARLADLRRDFHRRGPAVKQSTNRINQVKARVRHPSKGTTYSTTHICPFSEYE